jgi:hypothetical protein
MFSVAVARTPLLSALSFSPKTTHIVLPVRLEHVTFLLAAVAAAPGVTLTLETADAGYAMIHCKAVGCAPPDVVKDRFRLTLRPGMALPEPNDSATCCAIANPEAATTRLAPASKFIST